MIASPSSALNTASGAPRRRLVAFVLLSWLAAGALYLALPPSPDQFNHAYLGWRLTQGERLNLDVMDINWPGISWGHAIAIWIFGARIWSWHAFDLLAFALASVCLADLLRLGYGRRECVTLVLIAPWAYLAFGYWVAGQHDMSAAQCLALALWCHARSDFRPVSRWTVASGIAVGMAVLCKPTMGIVLALLPLQGLWLRRAPIAVTHYALTVAAAASATVALCAWLLVLLGTPMGNLIDAMWTFSAARRLEQTVDYAAMLRLTGWWPLGLAAICLPAICHLASPEKRSVAASSILLLWLTGVVSYFIQGRGNSYHLAPAALACMAWAAAVLSVPLDLRRPAAARLLPALLSAVFMLGVALRLIQQFDHLPAALRARDPTIHLEQFRENDGLTLADSWRLARDLAQRDDSGCLLVVGRTSSVNVLSGLVQPTRFYYLNTIQDAPAELAPAWTQLWEDDLARATCRFALVADAVWLPSAAPSPYADRVGAALRRLLEAYGPGQRIGDARWLLHERRAP